MELFVMKISVSNKIKIFTALGLVVLLALLTWFFLSDENISLLQSIFAEKHRGEALQDKLSDLGFRGHFTIAVLSMLQVLIAFLPAEPVQVVAGVSFGFPVGLACCAAGVFFGNLVVYVLYHVFGEKLREYFVKNLQIDFEKAAVSEKIVLIVFILYFLPAIPYGMICFFAASVGMKYPRYAIVTFLGSLPSISIGVGLGNMAIVRGWVVSLCVFFVLLALLAVALINRKKLFERFNLYIAKTLKNSGSVRFYKPSKLFLPYVISRIVLFIRGVRVRYTDLTGDALESPAIVLCNHGSFIDFAYAGTLLRKKSPNFIVARLYFYHGLLAKLLRSFGCFPKSMFAMDVESTKNSISVLRNGGVLAMMPEARLSTVGRFEDIQPNTYGFLKKMKVPIYTVKICGDYLADPKWGHGIRRGALVEATLEPLLTADEVEVLSIEEIRTRVEERLAYDELTWLKTHPELRYRSKKLAEGLENILFECPVCGEKYTIFTEGRELFCEKCGKLAVMDDRYSFDAKAPFSDFASWYDWQMQNLRARIEADPDYTLSAKVTLCRPSLDGKKMLRRAGEGICTLNAEELRYEGTQDGETVTLSFPMKQIYRLLFGAGEDFEIYVGSEIYYFVPEERRQAVEWYMTSILFSDNVNAKQ